jgi:tetraprenyl-beta-curcumene synthase
VDRLSPRTRGRSAFASAARRYWLDVFPVVRREIWRLRRRAEEIPDPELRRVALAAQARKWDNLEGAAAFAAFAPRSKRATVARLLVGLQSIYDYADTLMEQPSEEPSANALRLHEAILVALRPRRAQRDYYAYGIRRDDGGYLPELVDTCQAAIGALPSQSQLAEAIQRSAQRIVFYQGRVNLSTPQDHPMLTRWAAEEAPTGADLRWWEAGAACGSSMALFALVAEAARPGLGPDRAATIETAYWPWVGALHTLLDSLIDRAEDAATGQLDLLGCYASAEEMAERMRFLAGEAVRHADIAGIEHRLILAGATGLCLSDQRAWLPDARLTSEGVLATVGDLATPAMFVLRVRRLARRGRS